MGVVQPVANFRHVLARIGLGVDDLAQRTTISRAAIFAWLNPDTQPRQRGIRLKNAWAVARVYADLAGIDVEAAFALLFEEHPPHHEISDTQVSSGG